MCVDIAMGYVAIDMPKVAQRFTQTSQHHTGAHTVALPAERVVAQSGRDASGKSSGREICRIWVWLGKKLTGAKRREWMGMGVAGIIITSDYGLFPHSLRLAPVRKRNNTCLWGVQRISKYSLVI